MHGTISPLDVDQIFMPNRQSDSNHAARFQELPLAALVFLRQFDDDDDGAVLCGRAERLAELATRQALPAVVTPAGVSVCGGMITRGRAAEAVVATTSAAVPTAP